MSIVIEDESGKDAVLFHTNYSRLRHPFPMLLRTIPLIEQYVNGARKRNTVLSSIIYCLLLFLLLFVLQTARTRTLRCSVRNHDHYGTVLCTVLYCTVQHYATTSSTGVLALRYSKAMHNRATKRTEIAVTFKQCTTE